MRPRATICVSIDRTQPDAVVIADAARRIRDGQLVAFPTETVYGLGAHAMDPRAVAGIFAAKGRPATDPLIVHVAEAGAYARSRARSPMPLRCWRRTSGPAR